MGWKKVLPSENELISNKKEGRIYVGNFKARTGKYISITSVEISTPIQDDEIAIVNYSPHIELRISYIEARDNTNSFRLKKIKRTSKGWVTDGEISLSDFTISDLENFSKLLSKISLKNITQSKIDIEDLKIDDEGELEKQLRTITATPVGRKLLTIIAKSQSVSDADIVNIVYRKEQLKGFKSLLEDEKYFETKKKEWSVKRDEDVWQKFFEKNPWIFGYGLNLIGCSPFNDEKLEQIVAGASTLHPGGKRIDALLKTRGFIKSLMFTEIKIHKTALLKSPPYRPPDTYQVSDDLSGACSQVQKTIHKTLLKLTENSHKIIRPDGSPTGEEVAIAQPKGVVIIGSLKEFEEEKGVNFEKFCSFELYRRNIQNPEILTFDELYERAKFIVENEV